MNCYSIQRNIVPAQHFVDGWYHGSYRIKRLSADSRSQNCTTYQGSIRTTTMKTASRMLSSRYRLNLVSFYRLSWNEDTTIMTVYGGHRF